MSNGRPDYNLKVVPIPEVIGDDEERWRAYETKSCAAYTQIILYSLTVPSSYDLYVTYLELTTNRPFVQEAQVVVGSLVYFIGYWDTILHIPIVKAVGLEVLANTYFAVYVTNNDDINNTFAVSLGGYKRLIL